jgi:hypothetical protein
MRERWKPIPRRQMPVPYTRFRATGTPKRAGADRPQPGGTAKFDEWSTSPLEKENGAAWRERGCSLENSLASAMGSLSSPMQHFSQLGECPRHISPEHYPQYAAPALS